MWIMGFETPSKESDTQRELKHWNRNLIVSDCAESCVLRSWERDYCFTKKWTNEAGIFVYTSFSSFISSVSFLFFSLYFASLYSFFFSSFRFIVLILSFLSFLHHHHHNRHFFLPSFSVEKRMTLHVLQYNLWLYCARLYLTWIIADIITTSLPMTDLL